jgi:ribonucleoside-diphosphate reductase alpha chain
MRLIEKRAHELEPGDRLSRFDSTSEEGMVEVLEVRDEGRYDDTYCFTEPKRHRGVFNHVLTGQCTEITLHTNAEEIAVCNLGSINLVKHLSADGSIDYAKLAKTTKLAVRMLDNVIDINYYSVDKARHSNLQHRPIGLGIMGFQDALYLRKTSYSSFNAVTFADQVMSFISYNAIHASCELALERGVYSSYEGSLWSQGILPIHSQLLLEEARIETCGKSSCRFNDDVVESLDLDWEALASKVCHQGMRNSNVLAIAPTATISNICGVSQSIEPTYQNLFVKSNLSGEFTVINPYLVADLKAIGLWDDVMLNDLKHYDGSVQSIERIPETLKAIYLTAFEHDQYWLISAAAARQKWIDQAQSLNLYLVNPKGVELDALYRFAWLSGLKTTYYLRTMAATHVEKSTAMQHAITSPDVDDTPGVKMCLLDDPTCEACQ